MADVGIETDDTDGEVIPAGVGLFDPRVTEPVRASDPDGPHGENPERIEAGEER